MDRRDELMTVSENDIFIQNYRAVYNAMTAKPDCRSRAYTRNVIVEFGDICELNKRITDKFKKQYDNAGFSMNALISLKGREKLELPNWLSFEEHNWIESQVITGMVLTWEFNVLLPKYDVPQRHTLTIKISNGIRPEEIFALMLSGKLEQMDEIEQNVCPVVAKMDFVDTEIGNEVLNMVSDWVQGLKTSNYSKSPSMVFIRKYRKIVSYFIHYLTVLLSIFMTYIVLKKRLFYYKVDIIGELSISHVTDFAQWLLGCALVVFLLYKVSEVIANLTFRLLSDYGDAHVFEITKGDKNRQRDFVIKAHKERKKFLLEIIVTIGINILCGIVTTVITRGW